ncbi:MAG: F0F1 ATP synthase subunit B [Acidimicrobiia bacterium]|nr:F0F1 ATP synthase subunit B [Acidimicrobiia bacterium]
MRIKTAPHIRTALLAVAIGLGALCVTGVVATPAFAQTVSQQTATTTPKLTEASKQCIDKLKAGGAIDDCQKAPSPILPATNELIWGGIAFVILFFLLAKFAYPTIKKGMDDRAEKIRTSIDEAEGARTDAQRILEEYQRQLADARSESARIIEEARQAADRLRQDLKRQAETEVGELRARAQEDIQAQVQRAMADLQARVGELAIELAEKVVERSLDRETNMQLIENYINEVGAQR